MRGSDSNAALHYLARLLEAGDLPSACRRLMVCACEDVRTCVSTAYSYCKIMCGYCTGCRLAGGENSLADAVIMVCNAPKSNSAYMGINSAAQDLKAGNYGPVQDG